jgi:hypothetical protein
MPICPPPSESSDSGSRAWIFHSLAIGAAAAAAAAAYLHRRPRGFRTLAVGVIPARYASSRFEGKPLALILGKPMIQVRRAYTPPHYPPCVRIYCCCFACGFGSDILSAHLPVQKIGRVK